MGIGELKQDVREKIVSRSYLDTGEDVWGLLDSYDRYLESSGDGNELSEAAYLRGEAAFHAGRYHETVKSLTKSIGIAKTSEYAYLETDAYNMLGMLFSFVGYEDVALANYLEALQSARKNRNVHGEVSALLNAGLLYQGLCDYRKAMSYYKRACDAANASRGDLDMMLVLYSMIQEAQLQFLTGRYEEAQRTKREIDAYYQAAAGDERLLTKDILEVWMEARAGEEARVQVLVGEIEELLLKDEDYLEQIDFYVDFCAFLLDGGRRDDARKFLDILTERIAATEFLHLKIRLEELEVLYQQKYGSEEGVTRACRHFIGVQQECERELREFKRLNQDNISTLQELEEQRKEFEYRSKCDLATGLLNKDAFSHEVSAYLDERSRGVTDAMIIIDIDGFKLVNDSFGHLVGDEVIEKLAELMREHFSGDICGRFGGDEFMVFVRAIDDMEQLEVRVERFRERFSRIGFGRNGNVHNTVSVGVSYNKGVNASFSSMLSCADEALLKAKEYGKNRVAFFEIKGYRPQPRQD